MGRVISYDYPVSVDSNIYGTHELRGILVELSEHSLNRINSFVTEIVAEKVKESHHEKDGNNERRRFSTGTKGERALEILLNRTFIDWTIGDSRRYNYSDLRSIGLNVGVKSVEYGKAPLISKNSSGCEVMTLVDGKYVLICGFASVAVLNNPVNQSMDAVLSKGVKQRGVKTAFVGFDKLQKFHDYNSLQALIRNNA